MSSPITLRELETLLVNPDIDKKELAAYFKLTPNKRHPFAPAIEFNEANVAVEDKRGRDMMINWLNDLFAARRQEAYRRKIQEGWSGLRFIAEGDSWFQYPDPLGNKDDVIENLSANYAIYCMSAAGDTVDNMMKHFDMLSGLVTDLKPDGLLFSGGGNDIAGEALTNYLRGYQPGFQAASYISAQYSGFLRQIEDHFEMIFSRLTTQSSKLKIFCHGYDWAYPVKGGDWLGPRFAEKEIPEDYWHEIIKIMIDRFNDVLIGLAGRFPAQVYYIDCRGAIGAPFEWRDELHGLEHGVARVSQRFRDVIDQAYQLKV